MRVERGEEARATDADSGEGGEWVGSLPLTTRSGVGISGV